MGRLDNKIAVITGGGRGIGAATARLFASEGARVVVASRSVAELDEVAREIGADHALSVPTDVADQSQVAHLFQAAERRFGGVDILINNAGAIRVMPVSELSLEDWELMMSVNLRGSFLCAREIFRRARRLGRAASIVNIASLAGIRGVEKFPGTSAYSASKHGVLGLTEVLAVEGRPLGVRVNCIAPGAVDTKMLREGAPQLKTSTKPEHVAKTILFLSDEAQSSKLSGTILEIHSNE